jgi:hypothetical protein
MLPFFELSWMGGVAEHHYRRVRPEVELAWETLDASCYRPQALLAAQRVWTALALSEYVAIVSFAQVVRALACAQAPLDLIGMTSDFLADETKHVELASRVVMQLGGAVPRRFDATRLGWPEDPRHTPFQRANELALRVGCIGEAFASATAVPIMRATTHPLIRSVYETILRDEARHCRFGSLYFEWASEQWDDPERERLATVALDMLAGYEHRARTTPSDTPRQVHDEEALTLGWFEPARYQPLVHEVILNELVPQLQAIGLPLETAAVQTRLERSKPA